MEPKAVLAELLGAFALTFSTLVSIHNPGLPIPSPALSALTLGVLVYLLGPISGCLLNPAVTLGVWSVGRLRAPEAGWFIVAQIAGAGFALALGRLVFPWTLALPVDAALMTGVAELLGTALLGFTVAAVFLDRVPDRLTGVVIGAALLVGISWASHRSNGILNPAVALGVGSLSLSYVWGPVLGALAGARLARYLWDSGD